MTDFQDVDRLRVKYLENARERDGVIDELGDGLTSKAQHEADYRKALAVSYTKHRNAGKPQGESEILAKADSIHFSLARDMAEAGVRVSLARLEKLKDDRATIRHLSELTREAGG